MLSRVAFKQTERTDLALSRQRFLRAATRLPYPFVHRLVSGWIRAETWLRYPLWALNVGDAIEQTFNELDPDGARFGLTERARKRFRQNYFYNEIADLVTLFLYADHSDFKGKALRTDNEDTLRHVLSSGPGTIVAGFRLGAYAAMPWALGSLGVPVVMIVGDGEFARMGRELGRAFAPASTRQVTFVPAGDPLALARSHAVLKEGGIVSTLIDLSPLEYEKTTDVQLLGTSMNVAYGLPYLAAVTGRSIVPAALTRANGPRFTLRFDDALTAPVRDSDSVRAMTQDLYNALERMVLRFPDQWIGWQTLRNASLGDANRNLSHMTASSLT